MSFISIPVWCDWWFEFRVSGFRVYSFQFQYGAIGGPLSSIR
ncbi:hypothetical protein NC99_30470 [Sunxiuqinia dokdonensis]|uniref:Uncharacterized protein n=1 Tax=Sunxiuqinia dokdonensis TaxID=1409788 RepID=A0A0L8V6I6_9BACT|nr:hypothetical protein NC99_30470 [Sunxiuqinia dokdonensis]